MVAMGKTTETPLFNGKTYGNSTETMVLLGFYVCFSAFFLHALTAVESKFCLFEPLTNTGIY